MPIGKDENGCTVIDVSHDIATGFALSNDGGIIVGFDNSFSDDNRDFEPKAFLLFETLSDFDRLIKALQNAKKHFAKIKSPTFYPETDDVPRESKS